MNTAKIHTNNTISFKDQKIYVGIDVHKKSWKVTIRFAGRIMKTFSMDPTGLSSLATFGESVSSMTRNLASE